MSAARDLDALTHGAADWAGLSVLVTGLGVSGFAAADALLERGAHVTGVDGGLAGGIDAAPATLRDRVRILQTLGAHVPEGPAAAEAVSSWAAADAARPPAQPAYDVVVTSPGWRPDQPVLAGAQAAGVPVWGEVELAWRLRPEHGAAPWLVVTGTNGKTTTVRMLEAMLRAHGLRAVAAGNVGTPLVEVMLDPRPHDVLAVELSSFQLHWSHSLSPLAAACLNLAPDHLDWHGSFAAYRDAKARVYERTQVACVYAVEDPQTEAMVREADVVEGCRAIGVTLGTPGLAMLGLVEDVLADRAFVAERATSAAELGTLADLGSPAPPMVLDALTAAALARAAGVAPHAVREGLRAFTPVEHRHTRLEPIDGVDLVEDSKATNPHAAAAALAGYASPVWVAGGQLKGADVEALVRDVGPRLRGAVLIGQDRETIAQSLTRHAPDVPVARVDLPETGDMDAFMDEVLTRALALARPGDTVVLAPAGASWDQFTDYGQRGELFAAAARRRGSGGRG